MPLASAVLLQEYFFRFSAHSSDEKGYYATLSAIDERQAVEFASSVAKRLATIWGVQTVIYERVVVSKIVH